ncbi:hypothetical protein WICPIJ_000960 [Wickerhamomyces pijperi]|uniref:Uncharacterized protein n=1 Tax=Wickerhamomyces pijperi TaxID=599730 RepID=A0A9P8QBM9_WICPI|nr:hypothetical protein WICPIJ_000960 [Wickerhamomyces pijperi]
MIKEGIQSSIWILCPLFLIGSDLLINKKPMNTTNSAAVVLLKKSATVSKAKALVHERVRLGKLPEVNQSASESKGEA